MLKKKGKLTARYALSQWERAADSGYQLVEYHQLTRHQPWGPAWGGRGRWWGSGWWRPGWRCRCRGPCPPRWGGWAGGCRGRPSCCCCAGCAQCGSAAGSRGRLRPGRQVRGLRWYGGGRGCRRGPSSGTVWHRPPDGNKSSKFFTKIIAVRLWHSKKNWIV